MDTLPTLVVVSGPMGSGKTAPAHRLDRARGLRPGPDRRAVHRGRHHGRLRPGLAEIVAFVNGQR